MKKWILSLGLGAIIVGGITIYEYKQDVVDYFDVMYTPNDPAAVANDFWKIVLSSNRSRVKEFVMYPAKYVPLIEGYNANDRASIERVDEQDHVYYVKTNITIYRDKVYSIPLFTVVSSDGGQYKVDVQATKLSVGDAAFDNILDYYESAFLGAETLLNVNSSEKTNPQFVALAKAQLQESLCNLASKSTELLSGTQDSLFEECFANEDAK